MFTLEQIQQAHAQVKSGADFPTYIQSIKAIGVSQYQTFVKDGQTHFLGENNHSVIWPSKYAEMSLSNKPNPAAFIEDLRAHQQGKTDFLSFVHSAAQYGIEKWVVRMDKMTCTYYDIQGQEVLRELIPG